MSINFYNVDCLEFMKSKPDNYYDLAVVDPPYGIDVTKMNMGDRKRNSEDKKKNWDSSVPTKDYFDELFRVSSNQVIWGGNYFNLPISRYFAIWDKGETMYGRDFAECEFAWVRRGGTRIYKHTPNQLDRIHPTQKPISLYRFILNKYSKSGATVLDTHGGSMSSAIACDIEGFNLDICEIDSGYFDAGLKRFNEYKSQLTLF